MAISAWQAAVTRGFHIFPVIKDGKEPQGHWPTLATTGPDALLPWMKVDLNYNIGIACAPGNLVVIDCDTKSPRLPAWLTEMGADESDSGYDILQLLGRDQDNDWLDTYTVETPSGGCHLYYRAPDGVTIGNRPMLGLTGVVDVRASGGRFGGYVLAEGSRIDGKEYECLNAAPVRDLPPWLLATLNSAPPRPALKPVAGYDRSGDNGQFQQPQIDWAPLANALRDAGEGNRNNLFHWAATCIFEDGGTANDVRHWLLDAGNTIGLSSHEMEKTIISVSRRFGGE